MMKRQRRRQFFALTVAAASVVGIAAVYLIFYRLIGMHDDSAAQLAAENFKLYFFLSVTACAVFLALSFGQSLLCRASERDSRIAAILTSVTPILAALVFIATAIFYSYLTYNTEINISWYIVLLGVFEGALFILPRELCG